MNKDSDKTREQLIAELAELRKKSKAQEDRLKASNQQLQAANRHLDTQNQQLTASEAKFKSYIQNAPDGIFIANEKGEYIEVNKAACEITGYSEDELLKLTIPELIQEEYSEKALNHFQTVAKEGFASGEMGFVTKSGEKRFWSVNAVKLSETRFLGFAKEITEHKHIEEVLKNSEDLLNETAMLAKVGGWKINLIGETLAWTNETFRIHELDQTQQPNVMRQSTIITRMTAQWLEKLFKKQ